MRIRTHTNPFNYFTRLSTLTLTEIFPTPTPTIDFEVGFGRGLFIREYASQFPTRNIIGVEVRKNVVLTLQEKIKQLGLKNVHLIHGNAQIVLEDCLPDQIIDRCFVFHPDPWFKKSHHKRRVINPKFLAKLHEKLSPNGRLYLSTDVAPLWEGMKETLENSSLFLDVADPEFWEVHYKTNWQKWSDYDKRNTFFGTFQKT